MINQFDVIILYLSYLETLCLEDSDCSDDKVCALSQKLLSYSICIGKSITYKILTWCSVNLGFWKITTSDNIIIDSPCLRNDCISPISGVITNCTPSESNVDFTCQCPPGFGGRKCETRKGIFDLHTLNYSINYR